MFNCKTAAQKNPEPFHWRGVQAKCEVCESEGLKSKSKSLPIMGVGSRPWPRDQPTGEMKLLTGAGRPPVV